ncbi:MAG: alanine--glyoxylate aminotransferase family protein, partial [Pseudomonadota bacterium]
EPTESVAAIQSTGTKLAAIRPGYVLLNPGPVNTSTRVKSAYLHCDVCHREPEFSEDLVRLTGKLRRIFRGGPEHRVVVLTGSGTAAMECAIASAVPEDGKILVIDNGAFGERLAEIATLHGMAIVHLRYAYGEQVVVDDVRALLAADRDIAVVAMVHHETSVGLLNPVGEIGSLCRQHGCLLLVDAVSSLGAEDVDVVRDRIDICWSSANKCLHSVPGVSFLCVAPRVWPRIARIKPRVFYLDLKRYSRYLEDQGQTPFTPAVATIYALEAACDEYLEDGREMRLALYRSRNNKLREGLQRLGFGFFTETGVESHSVLTVRLPDGIPFSSLYEGMKRSGFVIYDCKSPLKGQYFQIANMGELPEGTLDAFLEELEARLSEIRAVDRAARVAFQ